MQPILVKVHQFTMEVNPELQLVFRVSTSKSGKISKHLVTVEKLRNKALVEYSRIAGLPVNSFNGHGYVKVFGRVLNIANGNQVFDRNITNLFI